MVCVYTCVCVCMCTWSHVHMCTRTSITYIIHVVCTLIAHMYSVYMHMYNLCIVPTCTCTCTLQKCICIRNRECSHVRGHTLLQCIHACIPCTNIIYTCTQGFSQNRIKGGGVHG